MLQLTDTSEQKQSDEKQEENRIKNDCGTHDLFNGYVSGAQLLDLRDFEDYEKSHIHSAVHVDVNTPEKAMIKASKKVICYGCKDTDKYDKVYRYCTTAKNCQKFRVTSDNWEYTEFEMCYPFMCLSVEKDKKTDSERRKYPNYIIDRLYLGDMWNRKSIAELKELGISHIIDATQDVFDTDSFKILKISLGDIPSAPIEQYFDKSVEFVDNALEDKDNSVFIHCQMGISRSTTLVLAYLMKSKGYTLYDGYTLCQQNRPRIRPNDGFFQRLSQYEIQIHNKSTKERIESEELRNKQECLIM